MIRLFGEGVPIRVVSNEDGNPLRFAYLDRSYRIKAIYQPQRIDTDWWSDGGRIWRHCLTVETHEGPICELYQDLLSEQWFLSTMYD